MAQQKYITLNDLLETSAADLNENAEIMINNGTEPMKATKVKLSTILGGVKKDIANLDGDIVAAQGDIEDLQTAVQNKANSDLSNVPANIDYVVDYKKPTESDPNWYTKWKSGKLEQGGQIENLPATDNVIYTLLKPFANDKYTLFAQVCNLTTHAGDGSVSIAIGTRTPTTFGLNRRFRNFPDGNIINVLWEARGQGAQ